MNNQKIITIGSVLVDIFIKSTNFEISGEHGSVLTCRAKEDKMAVDSFELCTGGGAGNTAVGFARLGFEVSCVSETGKDQLAELVIADLEREDVSVDTVVRERKEETGGSVLLIEPSGERLALVHRGAASMLDPQDIPLERLGESDWIHLSSISGRLETLRTIFQTVRDENLSLSWNPGSAELELLREGTLPSNEVSTHILFVNDTEWESIANRQQELLVQVPLVIVTRATEEGSIFTQGVERKFSVETVKTVDATGAGDAFATGVVAGLLQELEIDEAIDFGKKESASVVGFVGAKRGLLRQIVL